MAVILRKTDYQCDVYNNGFSFDSFADAIGSESIDGVRGPRGSDGFDGLDDGSGLAGLGGLDGLGDSLNRRELSNETLRYSPLKTWLCSSTKQKLETG